MFIDHKPLPDKSFFEMSFLFKKIAKDLVALSMNHRNF